MNSFHDFNGGTDVCIPARVCIPHGCVCILSGGDGLLWASAVRKVQYVSGVFLSEDSPLPMVPRYDPRHGPTLLVGKLDKIRVPRQTYAGGTELSLTNECDAVS